jgi:hypothetical protein
VSSMSETISWRLNPPLGRSATTISESAPAGGRRSALTVNRFSFHVDVDRVRFDARQVKRNHNFDVAAPRVHRDHRRAGHGSQCLLGEPVEFAERIGADQHRYHLILSRVSTAAGRRIDPTPLAASRASCTVRGNKPKGPGYCRRGGLPGSRAGRLGDYRWSRCGLKAGARRHPHPTRWVDVRPVMWCQELTVVHTPNSRDTLLTAAREGLASGGYDATTVAEAAIAEDKPSRYDGSV